MMAGLEPLLRAQSIKKAYGGVTVLDGVGLEVLAGEFLAVVGPSGSGKSTLLHILGCVERADAGEVEICGKKVSEQNQTQLAVLRNRDLGFVFQFFYFQPHLTVAKNLEVPMMPLRVKASERRERVQRVAELVGISDKLSQRPNKLSGGQLQRAAIARAIINRPKIILADEPTGNLDRENTGKVMELLLKIKREQNTALVIVTHDEAVARMADRVMRMEDGRLVQC